MYVLYLVFNTIQINKIPVQLRIFKAYDHCESSERDAAGVQK